MGEKKLWIIFQPSSKEFEQCASHSGVQLKQVAYNAGPGRTSEVYTTRRSLQTAPLSGGTMQCTAACTPHSIRVELCTNSMHCKP